MPLREGHSMVWIYPYMICPGFIPQVMDKLMVRMTLFREGHTMV